MTRVITPVRLILAGSLLILLSACVGVSRIEKQVIGGDAEQGREAIQRYGCGACHQISGIPGANATVGPSLVDFEHRHYIAGRLPNTAANLTIWIQSPKSVDPLTAMPDLGVSIGEARNIAAYLYR